MLEKIIHDYLKRYIEKPFLLALSGGPDSIALFHLLLQEKVTFHVAHINHNWRKESNLEAEQLEKMCKEKNIVFHSKKLFPEQMSGNLEDLCRQERRGFFKEVISLHSLQGVMLAHHIDDQAETVLKRVLEGAFLSKLKGLASYTIWEDTAIFRPLIEVRKKEIIKWLEIKNISYFVDSTNLDKKFLRARLRKEVFPLLSHQFGKEVTTSLARLAQYSAELNEFLEFLLEPYKKLMFYHNGLWTLDFSQVNTKTKFETKMIVREFFQKGGLTISYPTLEMVLLHLQKDRKKELIIGKNKVVIAKKIITIFPWKSDLDNNDSQLQEKTLKTKDQDLNKRAK